MKNRYSWLLLIVINLHAFPTFSQRDGSIRGHLQDTAAHGPVADVTVTVLNAKDSSLAGFSRSRESGHFLVKGLNAGNYRLLITHVGYRTISRNFVINEVVRDLDIGEIALTDKSNLLAEVTVEQAPVTIRHDTVEFNAGSFKTKPDAVVEDLLKKLPGMQVDKDGTIKANGEQVKKVLVDGKEFFGNDPRIASKNLPADAVEKVQVFDRKSDQSRFTGFDDGNSQRTINLTIKKDKKHGSFGKVAAGGGNAEMGDGVGDGRYEGNFNLNQFRGDRQLSAMGMANNTNKQGFSFQDVLNFNSGATGSGKGGNNPAPPGLSSDIPVQGLTNNSQAITTTWAGGANFNDDWHNGNSNVHGNYFYNRTDDLIDQKDARQYLSPGNSILQDRNSAGNRHNENQRLALISDLRIDSFSSLKITSSFTYQNSSHAEKTVDSSRDQATGQLLNDGISNSSAYAKGYSWNTNALLRHRFAKKGRTISANLLFGLNSNTGGGSLYSINQYFQTQPGSPPLTDTLNQVYDLPADGNNYGGTLAYTEPLSKKSLLEFNYDFSQSHSQSDKKTFDADANGKFTLPNAQLTNDYKNTYTLHREGIQFRNQQRRFNFTVGAALQQAFSWNHFSYFTKDSILQQSFVNVLPNANLQYSFDKYKDLRLFYTTYTNQPGITQLAPVPDNSDPLNIKLGNPGLKQEYYHSLRLNYVAFDPFRRTSFFAMLNFNDIHNRIVNEDAFDSAGVRTTRPGNLDGTYSMNGFLSWGLPLRALKSNLNLNSSARYDHNASLVNEVRNNGNTWTLSQGADLNFIYKELLDITGGIKVDYNDTRYSLQPGQNQHYWTTTYTVDFNWYLPGKFSIASDLDYIHRSGLPAGYNSSPLVWNAGLAKKVFKNQKGTIRIQVFDILKQNTGFSRSTSQNYIDDLSYKVLNRYWLLSFTYAISRFAGKSVQGGMGGGKADIKIIR
ncbi:MAG TPA: outer membrane beta-barrel family protein [Puia sp.]|nr:outer membrane beta-barrel family protein [Puia sp.]